MPAFRPRISVVIPAYNCGPYISQAIDSVLAQSHPPEEVIVVDDGSTDRTDEVLRSYGDSLIRIYQENQGVSAARNAGIQASSCAYVAFLDADDAWFPNKLLYQMEFLKERADVAAVFTDFLMADEAGRVHGSGAVKQIYPIFASYDTDWEKIFPNSSDVRLSVPSDEGEGNDGNVRAYFGDSFGSLFLGNFVNTSSVVVRRDILEAVGGFVSTRRTQEDYELWLKIASDHTIAFLDVPLLFYRRRKDQLTSNSEIEQIHSVSLEVLLGFVEKAKETLGDNITKRRLSSKYRMLAIAQLGIGSRKRARANLRLSVRHSWSFFTFFLIAWSYVPNRIDRFIRGSAKSLISMIR